MSGPRRFMLGIILGLMMCFDLGGPVNKAAYAFATAGLNAATQRRSRSWARSWPPAWCRRWRWHWPPCCDHRLFSEPERENGRAAWLLGACIHLRRRHPVRGGRPVPGHPVDDVRRRDHRCADHGLRRHARGLRTAGSSCSSPSATCSGSSSPSRVGTVTGALAVIAAKQFAKPSVKADETPALAAA